MSRYYQFPVAGASAITDVTASSPLASSGGSIPNISIATAIPINLGGTGQTTANTALNALLPNQATHSGEFLTTDGTNTSWAAAGGGGLPSPTEALASYTSTSAGAPGTFIGNDSSADLTNKLLVLGSTDNGAAFGASSDVRLQAGSTASGAPGSVSVSGGDRLGGIGSGGAVTVIGGSSPASFPGDVNIDGGTATGASNTAGNANVIGGFATGSGTGGNARVLGGNSSTGTGGNAVIKPGTGSPNGSILIDDLSGSITAGKVLTASDSSGTSSWQSIPGSGVTPQTLTTGGSITSSTGFNQLQAASAIPTSSSTVIIAGSSDGQRLTIVNVGANIITLKAGGNVALPNAMDFALTPNSSISLIFSTATWYTVSASGN